MFRTSRACDGGRVVAPVRLVRLLGIVLIASGVPGGVSGTGFGPAKAPPPGWDASVEFGAQATRGASRTSSVSAAAELTYRDRFWEQRLIARALHSSASVRVTRRDAAGEPVLDESGRARSRIVRDRTNDRRFLATQSRWFFRPDRHYLFVIADIERNEPADIAVSTRLIGGIGYRIWHDKLDHFTAGIGVGRKRLEQVSGVRDVDAIGYLGLDFVRRVGESTVFESTVSSDFGDDNRFTELTLALTWRLRDPIALKLAYEARMNSDITDPGNPFDERVDARATVSLEIDVL